jgi:hypothetical protein
MPSRFILTGAWLLCLLAAPSHAQTDTVKYWKNSFKGLLNINQAAFSENWKAGGVNSIGLTGQLAFKAAYAKGSHSWANEIDLLYGYVRNEGQGFRKTLDRIYMDTKYGYKLSDKWDASVSLNFLSQFSKGYEYKKDANGVEQAFLISDFMAPAFLTTGFGVEYHPVDYFKVRLSPLAPRITVASDNTRFPTIVQDGKVYGVALGETTRAEVFAFQMLAEFQKDIAINLNLKWRYMLFANYEELEWKKVDHRLDLGITAKITKYVNVTLGGIMVYDYDQDHKPQYSQGLSLGFLYTAQNFEEKK